MTLLLAWPDEFAKRWVGGIKEEAEEAGSGARVVREKIMVNSDGES